MRIDIHHEVFYLGAYAYDPVVGGRLRALAATVDHVELHVHDYFSDADLWGRTSRRLDLSVLPYRFGTHSGWLEACHDLGTAVAAPDCGFYAEQRPCLTYAAGPAARAEGESPAGRAHGIPPTSTVARGPRERRAEREMLADAHLRIYEQALARSTSCTS